MQFRPIEQPDVEAVTDMAIEGMRPEMHGVKIAREKVQAMVQSFVGRRFNLVAFDPGPVAAIAAQVQPAPWEHCNVATVVMCYSRVRNVAPILFKALRDWADEDWSIGSVVFPMESDASPAMARLLRRYGFKTQMMGVYRKV